MGRSKTRPRLAVSRYRVELRPAAVRHLKKIKGTDKARLVGAIELLATDPRPPASRQLKGRPAWRVRVGDFRIIYTINDDQILIVVIALGHRHDIYQQ